MWHMNRLLAVTALTGVLLGLLVHPGSGLGGGVASASGLSDDEVASVLFVREEEKLARDVYQTLAESWDLRVFTNIAQSEQRHMDAVLTLIDRYGLLDPADGKSVGVFTDASLQELYDELIARGERSLEEALRVGAFIEEWDIADIEVRIDATDEEDVRQVYESLLAGSRNHLRAFDKQITRNGFAPYETEVLTQARYDEIADSPMERGAGI